MSTQISKVGQGVVYFDSGNEKVAAVITKVDTPNSPTSTVSLFLMRPDNTEFVHGVPHGNKTGSYTAL